LWQAAREQFRRRPEVDMEAHARAVVHIVEELLAEHEPGDRETALAAAALHDVGIPEAIACYGSPAARGQEVEGARLAREILTKAAWPKDKVELICEIIGHHHQRPENPAAEFCLLYADLIVNAEEAEQNYEGVAHLLHTKTAKRIARRRLRHADQGAIMPREGRTA